MSAEFCGFPNSAFEAMVIRQNKRSFARELGWASEKDLLALPC